MQALRWLALTAAAALAGCGGGGGGSGGTGGREAGWSPGSFLPASSFAAQCAAPRSGIDPGTSQPYPDVQGSRTDENNWLRSWSNDLYLWYDEIVDRDPAGYNTTLGYFDLLRTLHRPRRVRPRTDFISPTRPTSGISWRNRAWRRAMVRSSQSYRRRCRVGSSSPIPSRTPRPRRSHRRSSVARRFCTSMVSISSTPAMPRHRYAECRTLSRAQANEQHTFTVRDLGAASTRDITLVSANVTSSPVQNVDVVCDANGAVGYILFNDHLAAAEQALIDAVKTLKAEQRRRSRARYPLQRRRLPRDRERDGVHDCRQRAHRRAGCSSSCSSTTSTRSRIRSPATSLTPYGFQATTLGFSAPAGQALPTLEFTARVCADGRGHVLGQRVDHQQPARRRRRGDPDRRQRPAASPTASMRPTIAARPISRFSSGASMRRVSATTRTASRPPMRRLPERPCRAARSQTTSSMRSGIPPKAASPRRSPIATVRGVLRRRVSPRRGSARPRPRCCRAASRYGVRPGARTEF